MKTFLLIAVPCVLTAMFIVWWRLCRPARGPLLRLRAAICGLALSFSVGSLLFADTNKLWWISPKPDWRPARISILGTNASQVNVTLKQYDGSTNQHPSYQFPDMSATNLEIVTTHQPVLVGGSNGAWIIRFKP